MIKETNIQTNNKSNNKSNNKGDFNMVNKKLSILNNNYINYKDMTDENKIEFAMANKYYFDTESCAVMPQEIIDKYNLTQVDYSTIEGFDSVLKTLSDNKQLGAKCYIFMIGSNNSNNVYYGNTIADFMNLIQSIDTFKVNNNIEVKPYETYVHNLGWDLEFIKYYLKDNNFNQIRYTDKIATLNANKKKAKSFQITENNGQVYGARVQLDTIKYKDSKNKAKSIVPTITFKDTMKIIPQSLESISKDALKVDEIYLKNSDVYNYNIIRDENYVPNEVEAWYQYCDIYLLKEMDKQVIQLFTENCENINTASQVAFDSILNISYKDKEEIKYNGKLFSDMEIYNTNYALDYIYNNRTLHNLIRNSYKGGFCTVGKDFKKLAGDNKAKISGVGIDITSSYPFQMVNKPLPYGKPVYIPSKYVQGENLGEKPEIKVDRFTGERYDKVFVTVAFTGWTSKTKNNQYGLNVKLGLDLLTESEEMQEVKDEMNMLKTGYSVEQLKDIKSKLNDISANEYVSSNYVSGYGFVGTNKVEAKGDIKTQQVLDTVKDQSFVQVFMLEELEELLKDYNFFYYDSETGDDEIGIIFLDAVAFKSKVGDFAKGIEHFFKVKEEAELNGNNALRTVAKVIINSFYGKHASRRVRTERACNFDKDIIGFNGKDEAISWTDKNKYAVQYASAVTAYGRIQLRQTARALGFDKFLYCDTDSIYVNITKEELIKRCKENNIVLSLKKEDKVLGGWHLDVVFEDFKAIKQKGYVYKEVGSDIYKAKCSGLDKENIKNIKAKEDLSMNKTYTKLVKKKVSGGYILDKTDFTLRDTFSL